MPRAPNDLPHAPRSRQELYDQIRASSKEAVILEEMIRYGFWQPSSSTGTGTSAGSDRVRIQALEARLEAARATLGRLQDIDRQLKEARKERLLASRARRAEVRAQRMAAAQARAAAWQERRAREIVYLGAGVSWGLHRQDDADPARLAAQGLPLLADAAGLAAAMGLTVGQLRFLAFHRQVSRICHYRCFAIAKKTGGTRRISAPMPRLKAAQAWVQENLLERVALHPAAHGFRRGHSILTNALPHVGAGVVINADVQDFFPTVTFARVRGVFRGLGYATSVATILALICTEPDTTEVVLDGQAWFVARGARVLPQGAPTSPALTNLLCRHLDRRLSGLAARWGLRYTRYADDLTFSGDPKRAAVGRLLVQVRAIVQEEGFTLHPDKTRIMRASSHQEVTGIVVNEKPNIDRKTLRRFRALLHQIHLDGPADKRWGSSPDLWSALYGYASFVQMVNPARGQPLLAQVRALMDQYASAPLSAGPP